MTFRYLSKSWGGCNKIAMPFGRVCGETGGERSGYMASEDEVLLAHLSAAAWREDPRPLSHPSFNDRRSEAFQSGVYAG